MGTIFVCIYGLQSELVTDWYSVSEMLHQILKSRFQVYEPVKRNWVFELNSRVPWNRIITAAEYLVQA